MGAEYWGNLPKVASGLLIQAGAVVITASLDCTVGAGLLQNFVGMVEPKPGCLVDAVPYVSYTEILLPHELYAGIESARRGNGDLLFAQFTAFSAVGTLSNMGGNFHLKGRKIEFFFPERQHLVPFCQQAVLTL